MQYIFQDKKCMINYALSFPYVSSHYFILHITLYRSVIRVIARPQNVACHANVFRLYRNSGISTSGRIFMQSCRRRKCCQPCCNPCCTSSKAARRRNMNESCFPRLSTYYIEREWNWARDREIDHVSSYPLSFPLSPPLSPFLPPLFPQTSLHQSKVDSGNRDPAGESAHHPGEDAPRIWTRGAFDAIYVLRKFDHSSAGK